MFSNISKVINIALLVVLSVDIIITITRIVKKDVSEGKGAMDIFLDCIPAIDGGLSDFLIAYKSAENNEQRIKMTVDFLYDIIAKNTTLDDKFPMLINKENVERYIVPLFLKAYVTELQK